MCRIYPSVHEVHEQFIKELQTTQKYKHFSKTIKREQSNHKQLSDLTNRDFPSPLKGIEAG
jgi:hypothetical protein